MDEAYSLAHNEIIYSLKDGGDMLDCGAHSGEKFNTLNQIKDLDPSSYYGIEWSKRPVLSAQENNLNVIQGDLNHKLPFENNKFQCVFGLSVLEHLLNPCNHLKECYRVLKTDGTLILLTPNISTLFTIILLLLGKMPSSGPHPDSNILLENEELIKVSDDNIQPDSEADTPSHRHLVVFSYRVLISYLKMIGFSDVKGHGFGLYPFPNITQPLLEKIDPYHCHQIVIIARK